MSQAAGVDDRTVEATRRLSILLPDGRSLDVWQAGPPDGEPLVFHHGTPGAGLAHGRWLAEHIPTAHPHLSEDHGHLTLLVDSFGLILDELVKAGG